MVHFSWAFMITAPAMVRIGSNEDVMWVGTLVSLRLLAEVVELRRAQASSHKGESIAPGIDFEELEQSS